MAHSALEQFNAWLPGELEYSVRKAPYPQKLDRISLGDGPGSTYDFLGTQWHRAKMMRDAGNHHAKHHQITAQLQLAKFAAGLYDKVAMVHWLAHKTDTTDIDLQLLCAKQTAFDAIREGYQTMVPEDYQPLKALEQRFEDTIFAPKILDFQQRLHLVDRSDDSELRAIASDVIQIGQIATYTYIWYAGTQLTPDQYVLAQSELAN